MRVRRRGAWLPRCADSARRVGKVFAAAFWQASCIHILAIFACCQRRPHTTHCATACVCTRMCLHVRALRAHCICAATPPTCAHHHDFKQASNDTQLMPSSIARQKRWRGSRHATHCNHVPQAGHMHTARQGSAAAPSPRERASERSAATLHGSRPIQKTAGKSMPRVRLGSERANEDWQHSASTGLPKKTVDNCTPHVTLER